MGNSAACSTLCLLSVTPSTTHNQIEPLSCCFPRGWVCVCSRTLWVSPMNSPVRPGVSPTAASTPQVFSTSGLRLYFPMLELWVARSVTWSANCCLARQLQFCPPHSTICHLAGSASRCLAVSPFHHPPGCSSPPFLLVWMNVSSLSPWSSDFHTV